MDFIKQTFQVPFTYNVYFTRQLFEPDNLLLAEYFSAQPSQGNQAKVLFVLDAGLVAHRPDLTGQIHTYFEKYDQVALVPEILTIAGGEEAKNSETHYLRIVDAINRFGIDRHSYLIAIGGGAVLDAVGYAAAIAHRGIRHIRIPTTVLSQDDSGVGVKNGINYQGKKNFLGTFAPPVAVINDFSFLTSLSHRQWCSGISEAVKVALIKDAVFFEWIEAHTEQLTRRDEGAMEYLIKRSASLHLEHISSNDPFEKGSSRPLDFGHWSAHKLEQISGFDVLHGEAVSIGIALDTLYSALEGRISVADANRVIEVLVALDLPISHALIEPGPGTNALLNGLEEFREHLGGRLTVMLLDAIGQGVEVHELNASLIIASAAQLRERTNQLNLT
ncbi:3-dehydroquinate synthase [bacterium A37T11]|nr:3-dehydroquinate synthase [bacterium A37T11]